MRPPIARFPLLTWLRLLRWHVVVTGVIYTYLGAYLAGGDSGLFSATVARAAIVVAMVIAFGNVINDCIDADADAIAKPHRPIPSGRVSLRTAWLTAALLALGSLLLSIHDRGEQNFLVAGNLLLSALYSIRLKGILLVGHAAVGLLCGSILVYGAMAVGPVTRIAVSAGNMVLLYIFADEVLGALQQEAGDRASQVVTTVTRIGRRKSVNLFCVLSAAFVMAALWPWAAGFAASHYLVALVPLTILPIVFIACILWLRSDDRTVAACSAASRLVWYTSFGSLVLLR